LGKTFTLATNPTPKYLPATGQELGVCPAIAMPKSVFFQNFTWNIMKKLKTSKKLVLKN